MMIVDNLLKGATLNDTGQRGMHIAPKSYAIRTVHATANPEISSHSDTLVFRVTLVSGIMTLWGNSAPRWSLCPWCMDGAGYGAELSSITKPD